jgi:osmotically-inducible protein OsmY
MAMQASLAEHLRKGNLVYHSYAGHLLLTGVPGLLKVRVIAPDEVRMARIMGEREASRAEAARYVAEVDDQRARWTRFIYGVDWRDPAQYDIVLNLGVMSVETATMTVAGVARSAEFSEPKDAASQIGNFVLASKVRLALAGDPASRSLDLEVVAEDQVVTIRGKAPQLSMSLAIGDVFEKEVSRIALGVGGVKNVRLDIRPTAGVLTD